MNFRNPFHKGKF